MLIEIEIILFICTKSCGEIDFKTLFVIGKLLQIGVKSNSWKHLHSNESYEKRVAGFLSKWNLFGEKFNKSIDKLLFGKKTIKRYFVVVIFYYML